ncbi:MAG: hypothetical protein R3F07_19670 [Opitutaceae bacterium]
MKDIIVPYRVSFALLFRETVGSFSFVVLQLVVLWGLAYWAYASFRPLSEPIGWVLVGITVLAAGFRTAIIGMVPLIWHHFYGKYPTTKTAFSTSGIYLQNEHGVKRIAWESIYDVMSSAKCYILEYGRKDRLFVPIQLLRDIDRLEEFTDLVRRKTETEKANKAVEVTPDGAPHL